MMRFRTLSALCHCNTFVAPQAVELLACSGIGRSAAIKISFDTLKFPDQFNLGEIVNFQPVRWVGMLGWFAPAMAHDALLKIKSVYKMHNVRIQLIKLVLFVATGIFRELCY